MKVDKDERKPHRLEHLEALIALPPQEIRRKPECGHQLFGIGNAVSARNTLAAIYDALRLLRTV